MKERTLIVRENQYVEGLGLKDKVDFEDYYINNAEFITNHKQYIYHVQIKNKSLNSINIAKECVGGYVDKRNETFEWGTFEDLTYFTRYLLYLRYKDDLLHFDKEVMIDEEKFLSKKDVILKSLEEIIDDNYQVSDWNFKKCVKTNNICSGHTDRKTTERDLKAFKILYLKSIIDYWYELHRNEKLHSQLHKTRDCEIFQKLKSFTKHYYVFEEKVFA